MVLPREQLTIGLELNPSGWAGGLERGSTSFVRQLPPCTSAGPARRPRAARCGNGPERTIGKCYKLSFIHTRLM